MYLALTVSHCPWKYKPNCDSLRNMGKKEYKKVRGLSDIVLHSEFLRECFLFLSGTRDTGPHILFSISLR